eukprot:m.191017 g.191017  ORF g.191017 m.191017 type:complete len:2470 (+) comp39439_c2_seq19:33-7442(+)
MDNPYIHSESCTVGWYHGVLHYSQVHASINSRQMKQGTEMGLRFSLTILIAFLAKKSTSDCSDTTGWCFPSTENVAQMFTATSTCGNPRTLHCPPEDQSNSDPCFFCDATMAVNTSFHPEELAVDRNFSTFWQSATKDTELIDIVTVQVNLSGSFQLEKSVVTFHTYRPLRMILEKSNDYGATWTALQYYAPNCGVASGADSNFSNVSTIPDSDLPNEDNNTQAFCITRDSTGLVPVTGGEVTYDVALRYGNNRFDLVAIVNHTLVTNLRVRFRKLATRGDELVSSDLNTFAAYYYAIEEWTVDARCYCYGHSNECMMDGDKITSECVCKGNTAGANCERCLPLFNNKPYMRGNSTHTNPCEECQCNNHSDSCTYNETKGFGVCNECQHNTMGDMCDQCLPNFFRDAAKAITDPYVCKACECDVAGARGTQCDGSGMCACKANVEVGKCDLCKEGFFNLSTSNPDGCNECVCNLNGTDPANSTVCEALTGQCFCKQNVEGLKCNACKAGFYGFEGSSAEGCSNLCACSLSTSLSVVCDPITGQCPCKRGLTGRDCSLVENGHYLPHLEGIMYEAEDANLQGVLISESKEETDPPSFTGEGGVKLAKAGDSVSFDVTVPPRAIRYSIIVRYLSINSLNVSVGVLSDGSGAQNETLLLLVAQPSGAIKMSPQLRSGGELLKVTITSVDSMEWFLDSIVLFPEQADILPYSELLPGSAEQNATSQCYTNREGVALLSQPLSDTCKNHTLLASSWLFNGTLNCSCFSTANSCGDLGGQCLCSPSTRGKTCSECAFNFYGFSNGVCQACNCSSQGSLPGPCDISSGQCSCKPLTTGFNCDSCIENHFNLSNCQDCQCSQTFSESMQCSEDGVCQCKQGINGHKCSNSCSFGFFNLTNEGCTDCGCNSSGSNGCDPVTGQCQCLPNIKGSKCGNCSSGYFDIAGGCLQCFCYGYSSDCQSAGGYKLETIVSADFDFQLNGWSSSGSFLVSALDFSSPTTLPVAVLETFANVDYFVAPDDFLGNQRLAYAQHLSFDLRIIGVSPGTTSHLDGDVVIKGRMSQDPLVTSIDPLPTNVAFQTYLIQLVESNFRVGNTSGRQATVQDVFQALQDVEYLHIRANYYQPPSYSKTQLNNIRLSFASQTANSTQFVTAVEECACPDGHMGLSCETCLSGYKRAVINGSAWDPCIPCQCNGHSNECNMNAGVCSNCQNNTAGDFCNRCLTGYYGNATDGTETDCKACPCHTPGSPPSPTCSLSGDGQPTCDSCLQGYTGRFCNACADGYFSQLDGTCIACDCDSVTSTGCDPLTGQCFCIQNVTGPTCQNCPSGSYDPRRQCLSCFCYDHASECSSAEGYEMGTILSDFEDRSTDDWRRIDRSGSSFDSSFHILFQPNQLLPAHGIVTMAFISEGEYFAAPSKFLGNKRLAYGMQLSFGLSVSGGVIDTTPSSAGDVRLKAKRISQPLVASLPSVPTSALQTFTIDLVETSFAWSNSSGRKVTVREMLNTLVDLEYLHIRANYYQVGIGSYGTTFLDDASLQIANFTGVSVLTSVENCSCFAGHTGLSCEECQSGYKREVVNGSVDDKCIPCQCNGHSIQCDVLTGVCSNCANNTEGNFCEKCQSGFYGNATIGNEDDCRPCPCPLATPSSNQFSSTCYLAEDGQPTCDACPIQHVGRQCEECADGYFGQPGVVGSSCQLCSCSGNIDLNQTGNCNKTTGECLKCVNNTSGFSCEECADGFFGDALTDSCQQCGCDPVGSETSVCHKVIGQCRCRPNVVEFKCVQCSPMHFGFSSGQGCTACDCHPLGSYNATCDLESGQCHCRTGVEQANRTCSICQDTFFNLTSTGCEACVCNETNTVGGSSSCNKISGQCPCVSGTGGLSCSNCQPGFFGSPPSCYGCGECYANWTTIIQDLLAKIQAEDARVKDLVASQYGNQTVEELSANVTALRDLLTKIMSDFDGDTTSLTANVNALAAKLTEVENAFASHKATHDSVEAKLNEAETKLNESALFNGTVEVSSGVYRDSDELLSVAAQLNETTVNVLPLARASASQIEESSRQVEESANRSNAADQLVKTALKLVEKAENDTKWVEDVELPFNETHLNNTQRLTSLEMQGDNLNASLYEYLNRSKKAVSDLSTANGTAAAAVREAQEKERQAREEKETAEDLLTNATSAFTLAEKLMNDSAKLNDSAFQVKLTAEGILSDIRSANARLNDVDASIESAKVTVNQTRQLTEPSVTEIESVAKMINETIVPEVEINATIDQSRESKEKALNILSVAQTASNLSSQASGLVKMIETDLANASAARSRARADLDEAEFQTNAVQITSSKVHEDASNAQNISSKASAVAQAAQTAVDTARNCRNDALIILRETEMKAMNACQFSGPVTLSSVRSIESQVSAVNESEASVASSEDAAAAGSLLARAEGVNSAAANGTQVKELTDLLDEFVRQKAQIETQRSGMELLEEEFNALLSQISSQCP